MPLTDLDRRRQYLDRIDRPELPQVADMVPNDGWVEPRGALRARSKTQAGEQVGRRLMAEFSIELDVQVVVFIALPGVYGGAESRDQAGARHATLSLQSVDDCPNGLKSPKNRHFSCIGGLRDVDSWITLDFVNTTLGRQEVVGETKKRKGPLHYGNRTHHHHQTV